MRIPKVCSGIVTDRLILGAKGESGSHPIRRDICSITNTMNGSTSEDHGPLNVGACVEVEIEVGLVEYVEEIESESPHKCEK
jgi:hypothetical protein